jgi:flagellar biosynthesis/type III secretory pathway protein FliH
VSYVTSIERLAREEGYREGLRKGFRKGFREGIEKARQEGIAEGLQIAILMLLELNFKKVPAKHSQKIRSVREIERLSELLEATILAQTLDEVLSLL